MPDRTEEAGRGLQMVDALSDVWGWSPVTGRGKAVWAILFCALGPTGPTGDRARVLTAPAQAPAHPNRPPHPLAVTPGLSERAGPSR